MILQELLFPNSQLGAQQEMYFRTEGSYDESAQAVSLRKGQTLSSDTYFNSFSIEKWMKYTILSDLSLELKLRGSFRAELMNLTLKQKEIVSSVLSETAVSGDVSLPMPADASAKGIYCFRLTALEDGCMYLGGRYAASADETSLRPVDIAIDICTFKREPFIERNLKLLNDSICYRCINIKTHVVPFLPVVPVAQRSCVTSRASQPV